MIPKSQFINKLRDLDYAYKDRQKRTELWRKKGGTHIIFVPFNALLDEEYVISTLRQAGCKNDEIRAFIASAKT